MDWLRLYHEARTDPKLALLSDAQHRVWFALLCYAGEQKSERGIIPAHSSFKLAAEVARGNEVLLAETLEMLEKLEVVARDESGAITFRQWKKRQYTKPSETPERVAERVANHRERSRASQSNAPATEGNTAVTPCNAPTEYREQIQSTDTVSVYGVGVQGEGNAPDGAARSQGESAPKKERKKPARPLPADFAVSDTMQQWAGENAPLADIALQTTRFVNYCQAKGNVYSDWSAAWRNWMLRAQEQAANAVGQANARGISSGSAPHGTHYPPTPTPPISRARSRPEVMA